MRRWWLLLRAGVFIGLTTWLLALLFGKVPILQLAGAFAPDWAHIGWQTLAAVGSGVITTLLVICLIPVFEWLFGITTEMSWVEMGDLNHPLLKRMMIESCVFRAVAELLGKDPWDLAPERFRHL